MPAVTSMGHGRGEVDRTGVISQHVAFDGTFSARAILQPVDAERESIALR